MLRLSKVSQGQRAFLHVLSFWTASLMCFSWHPVSVPVENAQTTGHLLLSIAFCMQSYVIKVHRCSLHADTIEPWVQHRRVHRGNNNTVTLHYISFVACFKPVHRKLILLSNHIDHSPFASASVSATLVSALIGFVPPHSRTVT